MKGKMSMTNIKHDCRMMLVVIHPNDAPDELSVLLI
jgi:hypothetical protein